MSDPKNLSESHITDQNFLIIWLNPNKNSADSFHLDTLNQLQQVVNKVISFLDVDECIDCLTNIVHEKVFMIIPKCLSQQLVPLIHAIPQLYSIYILSEGSVKDDSWTNTFRKIKKNSSSIECICETIEEDTKKCNYDLTPINVISSENESREISNVIPPSFMYSQILKEILIEIGDHPTAKEDLVNFWYQEYMDNESQLTKINEFDRDYRPDSVIRWYSQECFVYSILNRALRILDVGTIMKMGFFLRDLHRQINEIFKIQCMNQAIQTVYRGQGITNDNFERLRNSQGSFLSFNSFLSTSLDQSVARMFCPIPPQDPNIIAVLFRIDIDSTSKRTPFAVLKNSSHFSDEEEILFSMHSIFRIVQVSKIEEYLWEIRLKLTDDNDSDLTRITQSIRNEIEGGTGWHRLSLLLIRIGSLDKAEDVYQTLIKQTPEQYSIIRAPLITQLGLVRHLKGYFNEALELYNQRLEIDRNTGIVNYPQLAVTYNNIASIYASKGEYSKALVLYEKVLEIEKVYLPRNSSALGLTYNNIGGTYRKNGEYEKALAFCQQALYIYKKALPPDHPDFVPPYNNIATAYYHLRDYPNALKFHKETLRIEEKSFPSNHPHLASTHSSIALLYENMREYEKANASFQKTLEIFKASSSSDRSLLAVTYNNLASLHKDKKDYQRALDFYEKTRKIEESIYSSDHPDLGITYNNIATIYDALKEYPHALKFYEKGRKIFEKHLAPDHPNLAILYNNIGMAYYRLKNNQQALSFFQCALRIFRKLFPDNHHYVTDCKTKIARIQNEF